MTEKKLESLTEAQWAEVRKRRGEFLQLGLSTERSDRPRVERGITGMYRKMGLDTPSFLWHDSPAAGAVHAAMATNDKTLGEEAIREKVAEIAGAGVAEIASEEAAKTAVARWPNGLPEVVRSTGSLSGWFRGGWVVYWVAFYLICAEIAKVKFKDEHSETLQMWLDTCHGGWWRPHAGIVVCTERPTVVQVEDSPQGDGHIRLHADNGPALAYADGWEVYAVHGVRVPKKAVTAPDTYTVPEIRELANAEVRRIVIERFGTKRYLEEAGSVTIDLDTFGGHPRALVRDNESQQWLIVTDGSTQKVFHLPVPQESKTCSEAHSAIAGFDEALIKLES